MKTKVQSVLLMLLVLGSSGCGFEVEPVPLRGQPIVGHWYYEGKQTDGDVFYQRLYLHVREDGRVLYANLLCRFDDKGNLLNESRLNLNHMAVKRITSKKLVLQGQMLTPKYQLSLGQWPDQGPGVFEVDKLPLRTIPVKDKPEFDKWQCTLN